MRADLKQKLVVPAYSTPPRSDFLVRPGQGCLAQVFELFVWNIHGWFGVVDAF